MAMSEATKESALLSLERSPVRPGQRWKHYKSGGIYLIVATGVLEATLEPAVIYKGKDDVVWVRPLSVFLGRAKQGDTLVPRFALQD